jgi:hypothetical protein
MRPLTTDIRLNCTKSRKIADVEIIIGIQNAPREIALNSDDDADQVRATIAAAIEAGTGVLTLVDHKGRTVMVPTAAIAYVEVGSPETRRVGFGA